MNLPEKLVAVHRALAEADVPHAFGGALALAWCTQQARGTIDIDVNLFVPPTQVRATLASLPKGVRWTDDDVALIERDGQARLWWDSTPVDVFFNTTDFHERAAARARLEPFLGVDIPFLACRDLAVFKAFFNRPRDWVDLADIAAAGRLDIPRIASVLSAYRGSEDPRVGRVLGLAQPT